MARRAESRTARTVAACCLIAEVGAGATAGTVPNITGITQSTVTLRVPSDKFDSVLNQLGTGGTVEQQTRNASDVTDQVVDTTSRIASAQASIARITELMKSASALPDVV